MAARRKNREKQLTDARENEVKKAGIKPELFNVSPERRSFVHKIIHKIAGEQLKN